MRYDDRMTYRRRMIGDALRRFREERGLTQGAAGRLLERSQASLSAYENGHRAIRPRDLKHILDQYGVDDALVRTRLLSLANQGRQDGWWHDFDERLEPGIVDFASLEADASRVRIFDPQLVHGLFQTEDYARAVFKDSGMAVREPADLEVEVGFRLNRQRILRQSQPPAISAVFTEAVLHQQVGGAQTGRRQGLQLLELGELPHIEILILPFSAGMHPGGDGAFTILSVGREALLEVVAVDSLTRSWYVDEPSDVEHYAEVFDRLRELALPQTRSRELIERIVSGP
jgi:transcriptional regulator with XRE-family HTH domain